MPCTFVTFYQFRKISRFFSNLPSSNLVFQFTAVFFKIYYFSDKLCDYIQWFALQTIVGCISINIKAKNLLFLAI